MDDPSAMAHAPVHAWQVMHPPVQPHDQGWLAVGDGHEIYWEQCGHPGAPAALFVHGGPGAGAKAEDRRWFHPQQWRSLLFDQRGCGRSRADGDGLCANTTAHLLRDMEALRVHLGIDRWLVVGGSWGSTLALAYALAFPHRVLGLVLRGVFLGTPAECDWLYTPGGAARVLPHAWQRLSLAADAPTGPTLIDTLQARLQGNGAVATRAALAWCRWEQDLMAAEAAEHLAEPPPLDERQALRMARIGVHYAHAKWFLPAGGLLRQVPRLCELPGVILQGGRDLVTPGSAARALHAAWPGSQLREVPRAGHASSHPDMALALVQALETLTTLASITHGNKNQETHHGPFQAHA
jgi:proline iminopeptidase